MCLELFILFVVYLLLVRFAIPAQRIYEVLDGRGNTKNKILKPKQHYYDLVFPHSVMFAIFIQDFIIIIILELNFEIKQRQYIKVV